MYERILVAHDGSDGGRKALSTAIDLGKRFKAELHMLSIEELPRFPATMDEVIEEKAAENHLFKSVVAQAQATAKAKRVKLKTHVIAAHPVKGIVDFARRQRADLLVIGYHGHSALHDALIGGTAERIVRHAPCAVLVVK